MRPSRNHSVARHGWWGCTWRRWRAALRDSRGFTLTELVVTMFLSTVIAIGAFHIHATFTASLNRQDEISRIQGTMKITRAMLERKIRPAGAAMVGVVTTACNTQHAVGPFTFHNNNSFPVVDDSALGGIDNDPDWFEVVSANMPNSTYVTTTTAVSSRSLPVFNGSLMRPGGLIGLRNANGVCIFALTGTTNTSVSYAASGNPLATCLNTGGGVTNCEGSSLQATNMSTGDQVIDMSGSFALRIDNSKPARPVLQMAAGIVPGSHQSLYDWKAVAVNVEDMQIALHLDTTVPADGMGDIWINSRDLASTEIMNVRAVRISMVLRSNNEVVGWRSGRRPALEDRPMATTRDGYIRRVMTTVIKLRNRPLPAASAGP